jgi:hypothetical protein
VGEPYHNDPGGNRLWLNDGEAGFTLEWTDAEVHSMDVAFFDADGDGWLDLASANIDGAHSIHRYEAGVLAPWWSASGLFSRFEGNTLDFGDVDGDGDEDLVISDNLQLGGAGTVSVYCGPDFERCWESEDTLRYQSALSLEDVDGDGDLDLVAGAWGINDFSGDVLRMYVNDGGLETVASWTTDSEVVAEALVWSDLDGSHEERVELISEGGLVRAPQGAEIVELPEGACWDGRHVSGPAGTIVLRAPAPRDLAVSNWNKSVGNHLFARKTTP